MSNKKTDWKSKYYELRARYMSAIDVSFRLGFQEGSKASELQNMQMQLQQAQQQAAAAAALPAEGMPAEEMPAEGMPAEGMPAEDSEEMPSEEIPADDTSAEEVSAEGDQERASNNLDLGIQGLEELVSKNEKVDFTKLMKSFYKNTKPESSSLDISKKEEKINEIIKKWETR